MSAMIELLQSIGVFIAGVLARFGLFLALASLLLGPALAIAFVLRAVERRRRTALGLKSVGGVLFRPGVRYAPGHTWIEERAGGSLRLGLDDLATRLIPSVTAVELPPVGARVPRGSTLATLHGGGRVIHIPAPFAGTVLGVNAGALRDPAIVKGDGYGAGWLVALAPADDAWRRLPAGADAEGWLGRESARLSRFLEERLGFAAADGGELVAPAPWLVGEDGWKALTAAFLFA